MFKLNEIYIFSISKLCLKSLKVLASVDYLTNQKVFDESKGTFVSEVKKTYDKFSFKYFSILQPRRDNYIKGSDYLLY